ncbi:hypothetical protein Q8A73_007887 [Channa argus]|nr:hypothetical protein Q8A73_007887 [Channa argus]
MCPHLHERLTSQIIAPFFSEPLIVSHFLSHYQFVNPQGSFGKRNTAACEEKAMRPSLSVTLEPMSERGGPWGRDLYTFVTSAAGHMMRTLQKPRKNRPSKRQVNHRRFLHNMIQSKFADIEAANHRLASALYFKDEEKNVSSLQSQKPEMPDQLDSSSKTDMNPPNPRKCSNPKDAHGSSKLRTDGSVASHQTEVSDKKQVNSGHLWERHPKSHSSTCTTRKNSQSKGRETKRNENHKVVEFTYKSSQKGINREAELFHTQHYEEATNIPSKPTHTALQDAGCIQNVDISPSFSPLSLDSCDFSIQMFTDISACTHSQRSIAEFAESQWTDIMDLFSGGNNDTGGCVDAEAYFESICACKGDGGQETSADGFTFSDQSDSLTENNRFESEDLHCARGEYRHINAFSCHGDHGQPLSRPTAETQFSHFKPVQNADIIPHQLQKPNDCHSVSELQACQRPQEESHCMLGHCENPTNFTPFEGVAQSFSAPLHNPEHRPIPTPPQEDDWLFTDILKDRKSPDCALSNVCEKKPWAPCDFSPAVNAE